MDGWWRRDPFFIRYMAREATAIFVVIYALTLLVTLGRLAQGNASFDAWVVNLRGWTSIVLHASRVRWRSCHKGIGAVMTFGSADNVVRTNGWELFFRGGMILIKPAATACPIVPR